MRLLATPQYSTYFYPSLEVIFKQITRHYNAAIKFTITVIEHHIIVESDDIEFINSLYESISRVTWKWDNLTRDEDTIKEFESSLTEVK